MTTRAKKNLISKIAAVLVVGFVMALVPLGLQNSGQVQRSQAWAEVEPQSNWGVALLNQYAQVAGVEPSDFVVDVVMLETSATGVQLCKDVAATNQTLKYGNSLANNLSMIIDTVDYPVWSSLTAEQRARWDDDETNYNAAKFNELMLGFGMGDVNTAFYEGFNGDTGHKIDLTDELRRKVEQIGRIGSLWANGVGSQISSIASLITDREAIESFPVVAGSSDSIRFDGSEASGWPSSLPNVLDVGYGSQNLVYNANGNLYTFRWETSRSVFWLVMRYTNGAMKQFCFDTEPFSQYMINNSTGLAVGSGTNSGQVVLSGYDMYYQVTGLTSPGQGWNSSMPRNILSVNPSDNDLKLAGAIMLSLGLAPASGEPDKMTDYPEDGPSGNVYVYVPVDGISGDTTYGNITQQPTYPRPDNPYNPDNQTGGNQWAGETAANVLPLAQLPFDKLFPFCLLYDLPLLLHKIMDVSYTDSGGGLRAQSVPDYEKIVLDIPQPGGLETWHLEIDLTWLKDLLTLVRPALQVLLLVGFLWGSISFWKAVITG